MADQERDPAPPVTEVLYSYPRSTIAVLSIVAIAAAASFALMPGMGIIDIGLATLAHLAFALGAKVLFLWWIRYQKNGSSVGDKKHIGVVALLFVIGCALIIGPAVKINDACEDEPRSKFCPNATS
jgi:hypothetical protein